MSGPHRLLVFRLDKHTFALPLEAVTRVVSMVELTPLPNAPDVVIGLIVVRGRVVPVVDPRRRFGLPDKNVSLSDQLLLVRTSRREIAVRVDSTGDVLDTHPYRETEENGESGLWPGLPAVEGAVRLAGDIVLIHDPERFFTSAEEGQLEAALSDAATEG